MRHILLEKRSSSEPAFGVRRSKEKSFSTERTERTEEHRGFHRGILNG